MVSPAPYLSLLAGELAIETEVTVGAVALPSTLWFAAAPMAWLPSANVALAAALLWMVPLFRVSALAAISMPFASASVASTW